MVTSAVRRLLGILLVLCSNAICGSPVSGLESRLEDVVKDLPGGRIHWSTYWKLCWQAYPGAAAYELQAATSEGVSPMLRRQAGRCFRIEAAAGENPKSQGLLKRELLLKLQSAQLGYRVRAVLEQDRFSDWSRIVPVGSQK